MDAVLLRLYVATFLYTFAQALGVPLVPQYLELGFGASVAFIGGVMGVYGFMQILLRLPMGDMADRRGRRRSLLLAFAFSVAAGALFVLATSVWWAIPAMAFFGFSGGIFWVAANSYLFDRAEAAGVAAERATSDYSVAVGLSFLAGPLVGGLLASAFGFRVAFAAFIATSLVGGLLILTLPEAPRPARPKPTTSPYARAWGLLRHRALVVSALGTFLYSSLFATMNAFLPLHVLREGHELALLGSAFAGTALVGLLLSGRQAAATLVRLGLPAVLARAGPTRVLFAGVVAAALSVLAIPDARDLAGLAAVVLLFGAATGVMIPANLMLVHEGAPKDQRGLANGIYGTMLGLGAGVAPFALGVVAKAHGLAWAFRSAAAFAIVGALLVGVLLARRAPRPAPPTPA